MLVMVLLAGPRLTAMLTGRPLYAGLHMMTITEAPTGSPRPPTSHNIAGAARRSRRRMRIRTLTTIANILGVVIVVTVAMTRSIIGIQRETMTAIQTRIRSVLWALPRFCPPSTPRSSKRVGHATRTATRTRRRRLATKMILHMAATLRCRASTHPAVSLHHQATVVAATARCQANTLLNPNLHRQTFRMPKHHNGSMKRQRRSLDTILGILVMAAVLRAPREAIGIRAPIEAIGIQAPQEAIDIREGRRVLARRDLLP
jgi:hypothetical protein